MVTDRPPSAARAAGDVVITSGSNIFRPRARLIRLLGEELISDEVIAIVELVKNAYDADASTVSLTLTAVTDSHTGTIEIRDNGTGMTLETMLHAWLEPATSFKKRGGQKQRTAAGRYPLGEKGVGRFAVDKLGAELELISRAPGAAEEVRLIVSWAAYGDGDYLDEITNGWETREPTEFRASKHGTLLRIRQLRAHWDEALMKRVHEGLSRLISPATRSADFQIRLHCPEFPDLSGPVRNRLLETAPYRLAGRVLSDGYFQSDLGVLQDEVVDLREHAGEHFRKHRGRGLRQPACGPFHLSLSVWDLDALGVGGVRMTRPLRATLKRSNGVSIYRDGFRVAPYGDPGDDWLELNQRRVNNPTLRVSTNQIVGVVEISQQANPDLRDRTSREGFIEHAAVRDLKALVIAALSLLEEKRYAKRKASIPPPPGEDEDPVLAYLGRARLDGARRSAIQAAEQAYRQFKLESERRERALLRLAGAGAAAENLLGQLNGSVASITRLLPILERQSGHSPQVAALRLRTSLVAQQLDALEQFRLGRHRDTLPVDLRSLAQDALTIYAPLLASTSVDANLVASAGVVVSIDRAAVLQALLHVIDNAIVSAASMTRYRWIELEVLADPRSIIVCDSGNGIAPEQRDLIFDPFYTTREGRDGLGLYFARTLLRANGHDLLVDDTGSEFQLVFGRTAAPESK